MGTKRRRAPRASAPDQGPPQAKKERRIQAQEERRRALRKRARARALRRAGGIAAGIAVAAGLLLVIVRGSSGGVAFAGDIRTGGTLKSLKVPALQGGGTISYDQFRSQPLVINFFASWCPNCVGEMPGFQQVHQQLGSTVAFLGV